MNTESKRKVLTGGTEVASEFSIVDWNARVSTNSFRAAIEKAARNARSSADEISIRVDCTLHLSVRDERAVPELWQLDPSIEKIGCGGSWHYEGHSSHSACPSCRTMAHLYIDPGRRAELMGRFDRDRFPKRKVGHLRVVK